MPALQTHKDGSLTEEAPGEGSHSLEPGSSTDLERSHGSSPQGWPSEQGAHFSSLSLAA